MGFGEYELMTTYYKEKKKVNTLVDKKLQELKEGETIDLKALSLSLTANYEISEKAIYDRVKAWVEIDTTLELISGRYVKR